MPAEQGDGPQIPPWFLAWVLGNTFKTDLVCQRHILVRVQVFLVVSTSTNILRVQVENFTIAQIENFLKAVSTTIENS